MASIDEEAKARRALTERCIGIVRPIPADQNFRLMDR
jgi:hypothetical protein